MVDQVQHFDVCSVVNNRQTGAMMLQVRTRNGNVSDINMDSEKVEGLCFPLLFPHVKHGYHLVWATKLLLAAIGLVFPALVLEYKSFNCSMYHVPVPTLIEKFV